MAPFYGWCSTAARLEPPRGGSLLFTNMSRTFIYNLIILLQINKKTFEKSENLEKRFT